MVQNAFAVNPLHVIMPLSALYEFQSINLFDPHKQGQRKNLQNEMASISPMFENVLIPRKLINMASQIPWVQEDRPMILVNQAVEVDDFVTKVARDLGHVVDLEVIFLVCHLLCCNLIMKNHCHLMDRVPQLNLRNHHRIVLALLQCHFFHLTHHQNPSHNDILNRDNRHLYCNHVVDMRLLYDHLKQNFISFLFKLNFHNLQILHYFFFLIF